MIERHKSLCASGSAELPYIIGNVLYNVSKMYMNKYPKKHFKHVHISTQLASREYNRKCLKNLLIKNKPTLSIIPRSEIRENNMFTSNSFATINPMNITKITDKEFDIFMVVMVKDMIHNIRLMYAPTTITIQLEFTEIYETREQQLSAWWASSPMFELEPCQRKMYIKFPIPERFIKKLAEASGFKDIVGNELEITRELNKHSNYPICYDKDTATGTYRYFITIETVYVFRFSKADKDDGERKGDNESNFRVTRTIEVDVNAPHVIYYAYKDEKWMPDLGIIDPDKLTNVISPINTLIYDWLPRTIDDVRYLQGYSKYAFEDDNAEAEFNIQEVLFENMFNAYKISIANGFDTNKLIKVKLFINRKESDNFKYDPLTGSVIIHNGTIEDSFVIAVYGDLEVMKQLTYEVFDENYEEKGEKI